MEMAVGPWPLATRGASQSRSGKPRVQIVQPRADLCGCGGVRLRAQVLLAVVDRVLHAVLLVGDLAEVDQEVGELGQAVAGFELDAGGLVVAGLVEVDAALEVALRGLHGRGLRLVGASQGQRRGEGQGDEGEGGSPHSAIIGRWSCRSSLNLRASAG